MNPVSQPHTVMSQGLTPSVVAQALGLAPLPSSKDFSIDQSFSQIVTDSRKIVRDCLFVALPGEKFDGHDFIATAIAQGARGILCRKDFQIPQNNLTTNLTTNLTAHEIFVFPVKDTLEAYRQLASTWRHRFSIPIIAVAGSVGKTTTKEILASILKGKWPQILKTQASQNGFIGIPITLLDLKSEHSAAVIEIGIDEPGAMQQHIELVDPSATILTAIGPEHLEKLNNIETVAREESIALSFTAQKRPQNNLVAIHLDDLWIRPSWETIRSGIKLGYTFDFQTRDWAHAIDPRSSQIYLGSYITEDCIQVDGPQWVGEKFELPLPGKHNAQNCLGAIALAAGLGLTANEIRQGLQTFQGAEGRSELKELPGPTPVVCDYYNAQPASMVAGLELLDRIAKKDSRTRWACLADMLEMGIEEERLHRELAQTILSQKIENVVLYGPRMRFLEDELKKRGFQGYLKSFSTHAELAQAVLERLQTGDAILIKGSRGMKMEEVWKILQIRFKKAEILEPSAQNISKAAQAIARNEVIGMPTETVYGLAGNAFSPEALTRIFSTKERPTFDPLIIHISPAHQVRQVTDLERLQLVDGRTLSAVARQRADLLIQKYWPGPLTLILPKTDKVPDLATSGLPSVAIRMPQHPIAQALIAECQTPLAAPSANRFGRISPTSASAVATELGDRIDLILEGGSCQIGLESTVLAIEPSGELKMLRPGAISATEIEETLRETGSVIVQICVPTSSPNQSNQGDSEESSTGQGETRPAVSPGMLDSHYAPSKPLMILPSSTLKVQMEDLKNSIAKISRQPLKQVGLLVMSGDVEKPAQHLSQLLGCPVIARTLSKSGDLGEAARSLFAELRFLDQSQTDVIFAEPCNDYEAMQGLGHAIADRLKRASFKKKG